MLRKVVASAEDIDFQNVKVQRVKPVPFDWSLDDKRLVKLFKPFVEKDTQTVRPDLAALHYNGLFIVATDAHKAVYMPVPSSMRKNFGEPGTYLFPDLHTAKRYEKIEELLTSPAEEVQKETKRIRDRYPDTTVIFPSEDDVLSKGKFSPYKLLKYINGVKPYGTNTDRDAGIMTKIDGKPLFFNPYYLASVIKFFLQLGFEDIYFHKANVNGSIEQLIISSAPKFPPIRNSIQGKRGISPRQPEIIKPLSFERDTAAIIMPKMLSNERLEDAEKYGLANYEDDKFVTAYYDFSKDAIIDEGKEINISTFEKSTLNVKTAKAKAKAQKQRIRLLAMAS